MRCRIAVICCGLLLALSGCNWFHDNILSRDKKPVASHEQRPSKEALIAYVNRESEKLNSLQVNNLANQFLIG